MMLDYPFRFDERGRTATAAYEKHIRDMIEQVLFTNPGERVNRPQFGSGLLQLVFAPNSPQITAATQLVVEGSLQQWLGDLIKVRTVKTESRESTLVVTIEYEILSTSQSTTLVLSTKGPVAQ